MVNHYSSYNDVTAPHQVQCEKFDLVNFWFLTSAWYTFWHSFGYCTGAVVIIAHKVRLLLVFRANSILARLSDGWSTTRHLIMLKPSHIKHDFKSIKRTRNLSQRLEKKITFFIFTCCTWYVTVSALSDVWWLIIHLTTAPKYYWLGKPTKVSPCVRLSHPRQYNAERMPKCIPGGG